MILGFDIFVYAPGAMLFTPWYWFDLSVYQEGGVHIEITNPRDIGWMGPRWVGEIYCRSHSMAVLGWLVPRTPQQWRWEFADWWRWLRRRLDLGLGCLLSMAQYLLLWLVLGCMWP
jgi:hypothetical protein